RRVLFRSDWLRQGGGSDALGQDEASAPEVKEQAKPAVEAPAKEKPTAALRKKLSYKLQRELEQLPARIEALEARQAELQDQVVQPDFYSGDPVLVSQTLEDLTAMEQEINEAMER